MRKGQMTQFKGFGSAPKLIKGWLLPELQENYTDNAYNMASLKTTINLWTGYLCYRKVDKSDCFERRVEVASSCFALLCQIDSELDKLTADETNFKSLINRLKNDDDFYISFINKRYELVKARTLAGDTEDLNVLIKESYDYKDWLKESGVLSAGIELVDGWGHPLSAAGKVIDGEETMNTWAFASMICATATKRLEGGNQEKAVSMLITFGVLEPETWQTKVEICRQIDAEYIQIINRCHAELENKLEKAFEK
jgi:hypothetical protein